MRIRRTALLLLILLIGVPVAAAYLQWAVLGLPVSVRDSQVSVGRADSNGNTGAWLAERVAPYLGQRRFARRWSRRWAFCRDSSRRWFSTCSGCAAAQRSGSKRSSDLGARIHRELQNDVVHVGPGLEPVPLRPRDDRADHCRTRTRLVAAQEQPVLPTDGLIPQPPLRCVVVDRQPAVFGVTAQRLPLVQAHKSLLAPAPTWATAATRVDPVRPAAAARSAPPLLAAAHDAQHRPEAGPGLRLRIIAESSLESAKLPRGTLTARRRTFAAHETSRPFR